MNTNNWVQILSKAGCGQSEAIKWAPYFAKHCAEYKINTIERISSFVANVVIESQFLRVVRENLRYSAKGLARTWPNRYSSTGKRGGSPNAKALSIAGNQKAIANHCYANRMGNGNEGSGDGWRYAGKGPIQLTGKDNYKAFYQSVKLSIDTDTERLCEPDLGVLAACWFWTTNGINTYADKGDFDGCCDKVNIGRKTREAGDAHGYNSRKVAYINLKTFLSSHPTILEDKETEVISVEEMSKVIPPEITWVEQDPDNEYMFDMVKDYSAI